MDLLSWVPSNFLFRYFLRFPFSKGDDISVQLITDASFADTGGDMVVEAIVAFGDDGL